MLERLRSFEPDDVEFVHNLNLYGFRDKEWTVKHKLGKQRVIFVGDSFVEGFMASDEEVIPRGFMQAASAKNSLFETLNLGVGASNIQKYYKLIGDVVPIFKPEHLFLVFYENDFPVVPEFESAWLDPSFVPEYAQLTQPRLLYIVDHIRANKMTPNIISARTFPFIAPIPDPRNPWSLERNVMHFEKYVAPEIADVMKRGRFNPYAANSYVAKKNNLVKSFDIFPHLKNLKTFVENNSLKLFVVYIPYNHQVSDAYLLFDSEFSADKNPTSLMGGAVSNSC